MKPSHEVLTYAKSPLKMLEGLGLDVRSSVGRLHLCALPFITDRDTLTHEYDNIAKVIEFLTQRDDVKVVQHVCHQLTEVQDIHGTLNALNAHSRLTDVELFEIKHFALIVEDLCRFRQLDAFISLPNVSVVIDELDPEHNRLDTFYVFDCYSEELAAIRKKMKAQEEPDIELYLKSTAIEDEIRAELSKKIFPFCKTLISALDTLAYLDVLIAKAQQAINLKLCKPQIVDEKDKLTCYQQLFNPQVKAVLAEQGKQYQPVDVEFVDIPTLITGINMGGKTVLLRTLALAQYMCQFGFFVPASQATIVLVNKIMLCVDDEQNHLQGLSSFAAEMKNINSILNEVEKGTTLLVLIDELARTTNPVEGSAIVGAMLDILSEHKVRSFITSHYDNISAKCCRKRVRGLVADTNIDAEHIEKYIDYSLVDDIIGEVPHEALRIAELLGVNPILIQRANNKLTKIM